MHKQAIFDALKAKFVGVSDAILNRIVDKNHKTILTEEQVKTFVEGMTLQQVIDGYADSRVTEATQTAISNYEKKYNLKDGNKVEPDTKPDDSKKPDNSGGDDNNAPAWAKELLEQNKKINERFDRLESNRITTDRKGQLSEIIKKLPDELLRKPYERITLDNLTDEQFAELKAEVTAEIDATVSKMNAKGAIFGTPMGKGSERATTAGGNKEATDDETDAVVDRLPI